MILHDWGHDPSQLLQTSLPSNHTRAHTHLLQELNELEYYSPIAGSDPPAFRFNYWGYSTVGFFAPMSR